MCPAKETTLYKPALKWGEGYIALDLLHIILRTIVPELWPFIYAKISFTLNILRTNKFHQTLYMHSYRQDVTGIGTHPFSHNCTRVMARDLRQNFASV